VSAYTVPPPPEDSSHLRAVPDAAPPDGPAVAQGEVFRMRFPHGFPAAPVRRAAAEMLRLWGLTHRHEVVLLVTTELVQNVTQHTTGGGELLVALQPDGILIELADSSPERPVLGRPEAHRVGGRGMLIIASVARRWGCRPAGRAGKVVWVELAM
jgi:hypothetical protein